MSSNTNLGNTPVNQGYVQLFHTGETGGVDTTLRIVYDGDGTASDLYIATNKVKIGTSFQIGSSTAVTGILDEDNMASDSNVKLATQQSIKAYVDTEVSDLVDSAPGTLNTLNELAAALGDDASYAATITTALGTKLVKASNLSDLASASTARSNLGLVIGTNVQAYNSTLAAVAGGTYTGDNSIATVGTIGTGTWQGTAIASAYLDSDTAHLSGTQTFSGAKTFSSSITLGGHAVDDIDIGSEFTDADDHLMSAGAIKEKIEDYGYTTDANVTHRTITAGGNTLAGSETLAFTAGSNVTITESGGAVTITSTDTNTTYTGGTNLTLDGTEFDVDDAFLKNDASDTTSGTITAGGFTTTGTWTFDSFTSGTVGITSVHAGNSFNDNDTSLMTAGAIKDKIEGYGYTTNTGDITGVDLTGANGIAISSETNTTSGAYSSTIGIDISPLSAHSGEPADEDLFVIERATDGSIKKVAYTEIQATSITIDGTTANGVLTYGGTNNIDTESTLTWAGAYLDITSADDAEGGVRLNKSTKDGTHIQYSLSHRDDNQSLILYSHDGSTFRNWITLDEPNALLKLGANSSNLCDIDDSGNFRFANQVEFEDTNAVINRVSNDLEIRTYGGYDINLMSAGNVGIGTSSPGNKFTVNSTSANQASIQYDASTRLQIGVAGSGVATFLTDNTAASYFTNGLGVPTNTKLYLDGGSDSYLHENTADSVYMVVGGVNVMRFYETSSVGYAYVEDNFYLGVGSSIDFTIRHDTSNTYLRNETGNLFFRNRTNTTTIFDDHNGVEHLNLDMNNEVVVNQGGGNIDFRVEGDTDANLLVCNAGTDKVGIGTNSPASLLDVDGIVSVGLADVTRPALTPTNWGYSSSYRVLMLGSSSTTYNTANTGAVAISMGYNPSGNSYNGFTGDGREILFRRGAQFVTPNAGDDSMYLYNLVMLDGKVGIGTSSPTEKLTVAGAITSTGALADDRTSTASMDFSSGVTRFVSYGASGTAGIFAFRTAAGGASSAEKVRIDGSGNVGIGTSSPDSKLQVEYTTGSNGSAAIAEFGTSGSGAIANSGHQVIIGGPSVSDYTGLLIHSDSTSGYGQISFADGRGANDSWRGVIVYKHSDEYMGFWTNATEKMRIVSGGDAHFDQDVIAYSSTPSDIRLKKNFTKIENGLDVVNKLEGHTFNWKKGGDRLSAGFKAQEVEKILPHLVDEKKLPLKADDDKEYKILRYEEMIPYLVEAIKEQQEEIDLLKANLEQLKYNRR